MGFQRFIATTLALVMAAPAIAAENEYGQIVEEESTTTGQQSSEGWITQSNVRTAGLMITGAGLYYMVKGSRSGRRSNARLQAAAREHFGFIATYQDASIAIEAAGKNIELIKQDIKQLERAQQAMGGGSELRQLTRLRQDLVVAENLLRNEQVGKQKLIVDFVKAEYGKAGAAHLTDLVVPNEQKIVSFVEERIAGLNRAHQLRLAKGRLVFMLGTGSVLSGFAVIAFSERLSVALKDGSGEALKNITDAEWDEIIRLFDGIITFQF